MLELNNSGHIKNRECQTLEFKQSFQLGDSLYGYARTLVGMANNQGGMIVFGIQDSPHLPIGLKDDRFNSFDPKSLNRVFLDSFSPDVEWKLSSHESFGVQLGFIHVLEAPLKPIICTRNHTKAKLREGAIYYRYRAETQEIRYPELQAMLQAERDKEKKLWMGHIQSIASIGPQAVQIFDATRGEMDIGGTKVLIDSDLISKLKVIKEGEFVEKTGAPALKIVGEIEGLVNSDSIYSEPAYPFTQTHFTDKFPINGYEFQAIAWKLGLKGDARYHLKISTGKKGAVQKYSDKAIQLVSNNLRDDTDFVQKACADYKEHQRTKKKRVQTPK